MALAAAATFVPLACSDDPPTYSDYARMSERADECGPMRETIRGVVDQLIDPALFRVTDAKLFADGIWVLSHSQVSVEPGEYVIAHGTLRPGPPDVLQGRFGVDLPTTIRDRVAREGLFVAESIAAFPAGPPG